MTKYQGFQLLFDGWALGILTAALMFHAAQIVDDYRARKRRQAALDARVTALTTGAASPNDLRVHLDKPKDAA